MRLHERPSVYGGLRLDDIFPQPLKKMRPISVVFKNRRLVDSPHHNMVKGTRDV